jgi:ATP-binding cassette subfamily B protein
MAEVNAKILETVSGISVAKNFRREATIYREFDETNRKSYRINVRRGFTLVSVFPALNFLSGIGTAVLLYTGGLSVLDGAILIGSWFLFLQSLDAFWFPLMNLSAFWAQVQAGLAAIERVFALIDAEPDVVQVADESCFGMRGEIRFVNLRFGYDPDSPVLPDFSLHIQPGESVALVGHTGAGKTSLARLIARFYEFQSGDLLIDGHDIRALALPEYRRQLGIVPQSPFLFSGTVMDNIRYAHTDATDDEILSLSQRVGDGEWLAALPDGLLTDVGERGARLSMGQRQLVALMRVLLQQPAIFVLDEATASIDPFTEAQIQEAVDLILSQSTSVVIAHRLSTVSAADRIVVMADGRIIEEGSHGALMSAGGHYAELYDTYFRHQAHDYQAPIVDLTA